MKNDDIKLMLFWSLTSSHKHIPGWEKKCSYSGEQTEGGRRKTVGSLQREYLSNYD